MCGYARRHVRAETLKDMNDLFREYESTYTILDRGIMHFYPAFGGAASRELKGLLIRENGKNRFVDATWWFDCQEEGDNLRVNNSRTTFNARNLTSPYWKGAIRHHRGVLMVTGIGEGKAIDGKNRHYLVESDQPIFLGCVYRPFKNGRYSSAIITRDSHPRFEPYHDKAFPLMLPNDKKFLELWLSDAREDDPAIADLLAHPAIFNDLKITHVKTFKDAKALAEPEFVAAD
jgi:putative SOS response-associated peptidase YedK